MFPQTVNLSKAYVSRLSQYSWADGVELFLLSLLDFCDAVWGGSASVPLLLVPLICGKVQSAIKHFRIRREYLHSVGWKSGHLLPSVQPSFLSRPWFMSF